MSAAAPATAYVAEHPLRINADSIKSVLQYLWGSDDAVVASEVPMSIPTRLASSNVREVRAMAREGVLTVQAIPEGTPCGVLAVFLNRVPTCLVFDVTTDDAFSPSYTIHQPCSLVCTFTFAPPTLSTDDAVYTAFDGTFMTGVRSDADVFVTDIAASCGMVLAGNAATTRARRVEVLARLIPQLNLALGDRCHFSLHAVKMICVAGTGTVRRDMQQARAECPAQQRSLLFTRSDAVLRSGRHDHAGIEYVPRPLVRLAFMNGVWVCAGMDGGTMQPVTEVLDGSQVTFDLGDVHLYTDKEVQAQRQKQEKQKQQMQSRRKRRSNSVCNSDEATAKFVCESSVGLFAVTNSVTQKRDSVHFTLVRLVHGVAAAKRADSARILWHTIYTASDTPSFSELEDILSAPPSAPPSAPSAPPSAPSAPSGGAGGAGVDGDAGAGAGAGAGASASADASA